MTTIAFDTLALAKKLQAAGFEQQQAEGITSALAETLGEQVATKQDIATLRSDLSSEIKTTELRLTIKVGSMLVVAVGVLTALIKLI